MEAKIEEKIELYCRIYEQIYQGVSKSNLENAGEIALKIFDEVTRDLKDGTVQKSGENTQTNEKEEKLEVSHKEAVRSPT